MKLEKDKQIKGYVLNRATTVLLELIYQHFSNNNCGKKRTEKLIFDQITVIKYLDKIFKGE